MYINVLEYCDGMHIPVHVVELIFGKKKKETRNINAITFFYYIGTNVVYINNFKITKTSKGRTTFKHLFQLQYLEPYRKHI